MPTDPPDVRNRTSPSAAEVMVFAERSAKAWAKKHGLDWRDSLSAAWVGCKRAAESGASTATIIRMGQNSIIDQLRAETRNRANTMRMHQFPDPATTPDSGRENFDSAAGIPDRGGGPTPTQRLQSGWFDTQRERAGWGMRARVFVYLWAVEGWTMREIGETVGVTESAVSMTITRCTGGRGDEARNEQAGPEPGVPVPGRETGTAGAAGGETGAGGGTGEEVQPPGRLEAAGGCPGGRPGDGGWAADPAGMGGRGGPDIGAGAGPDGRGPQGVRPDPREDGPSPAGEAVFPADGGAGAGPLPAECRPPRPPGRRSVAAAELILGDPAETGRKAAALRDRMFDSVGGRDIDEVMAAVLRKAKVGDLKAADLFFSLLGAKK